MNFDLAWTLKTIPAAIIGLTVHEYCHALAAFWLGDTTAKDQGRLTLNPIKHIDPLGFLLIVIAGFGWAKPVRFDRQNLNRPHRDETIIALAGPLSNLVLGIIFIAVARVLFLFPAVSHSQTGVDIVNLLILWAVISFGLFAFNLIPLPPLDGSHVYTTYLKELNEKLLVVVYKFGTWILLGIILIQNSMGKEIIPISSVTMWVTKTCIRIFGF
jgi:Zn-dependent protease